MSLPTNGRLGGAGFTLIELLVVMTIMALVASVGAVAMSKRPGFVERRGLGTKVIAALAKARGQAISTRQRVSVDVTTLSDAELDVTSTVEPTEPDRIFFYPDGSSNGGVVMLGSRPLVAVDWLTGEARDAR